MKCIIDNFAVLGFETTVLDNVASVYSIDEVMLLDEKVVLEIAGETSFQQQERNRTTEKLQNLQSGLESLRQLDRDKFTITCLIHSEAEAIPERVC